METKSTSGGWVNRIVAEGEEVPDQLLANPNNFRIHPLAQQKHMQGLLNEIGWIQRVIVNRRTEHVIDGHMRVALAISRGEPTVPVGYVDLSEEEEKLALATFDLIATREVDREALEGLFKDARPSDADAKNLLAELAATYKIEVELPKEEGAIPDADEIEVHVQPGQVWLLGKHRLMCGDSTKAEDVAKLMAGQKAQLMVTDPPYGLGVIRAGTIGGGGPGGGRKNLKRTIGGDNIVKANLYDPIVGDDKPFDPVPLLSMADQIIIFGANYFASRLPESRGWFVWDKIYGLEGTTRNFSDCEFGWTNLEKPARIFRHQWHGLMKGSERNEKRTHPTQKPVALFVELVNYYAPDRTGVILDPFLGSGTTLIAAEQLGRTCYGMEISERYCQVSINRWENYTGRTAVLETSR